MRGRKSPQLKGGIYMALDLTNRGIVLDDLSQYEKRRFNTNHVCPICWKEIRCHERFIMFKRKTGRIMRYSFYHEQCLYVGRGDLNGEEE